MAALKRTVLVGLLLASPFFKPVAVHGQGWSRQVDEPTLLQWADSFVQSSNEIVKITDEYHRVVGDFTDWVNLASPSEQDRNLLARSQQSEKRIRDLLSRVRSIYPPRELQNWKSTIIALMEKRIESLRLVADFARTGNEEYTYRMDIAQKEAVRLYDKARQEHKLLGQSFEDASQCSFVLRRSYDKRDLVLQSCTRVIESRRFSGEILIHAFYDRGWVYFDRKDYDRAIQDYSEAIRLGARFRGVYYERGNAYLALKRYDQAISDLEQEIRIDPGDAETYHRLGNAYRGKKQYEQAIAAYRKALDLRPQWDAPQFNIGLSYYDLGKYDEAIREKAEAYLYRGNAYRDKKDYDKAIQDYSEAIRLNPNEASTYKNRGLAYVNKRDYDHAIQDYSELIRHNPNDAGAYRSRGSAYFNKGDKDLAIQDYHQAIRLNPKDALAYLSLGDSYYAKKDYAQAVPYFEKSIELNPKDHRGPLWLADAYFQMRQYERAFPYYEAAARINPKVAINRVMGFSFFYLGRMVESAEAMERRVRASPQDMYAILWRYMAQAKSGGLEAASRELGENVTRLTKRGWPAPVIDFYLGKIDERAMYAAAENPDPKKKSEQLCEANFYAAEARLLKGATKEAIPLLRTGEKECPPTFFEAHGASAELKRLGQR